jgi:hypothetical protein
MSRIHVIALVALSALAVPSSIAFGQVIFGPAMTSPQPGRAIQGGLDHGPMCAGAAGGSRLRSNCESEAPATSVEVEQGLEASTEPATLLTEMQCEATTLTEYVQRNTIARVDGRISVANCPTGTTGNYTLVARVRDESGEIKPIEFSETWQRDDAQDVSFNGDYPIGENVDLLNVRVRGLRCTCAEPASRQSAVAAEQPLAEQ